MATFSITAYTGDQVTIPVQINNPDGSAEDLSSGKLGITIKQNPYDSDDDAIYSNDVTGPENGAYVWLIPGTSVTGPLFVEIVKWDSNNVRSHLQNGKLYVQSSVTSRLTP